MTCLLLPKPRAIRALTRPGSANNARPARTRFDGAHIAGRDIINCPPNPPEPLTLAQVDGQDTVTALLAGALNALEQPGVREPVHHPLERVADIPAVPLRLRDDVVLDVVAADDQRHPACHDQRVQVNDDRPGQISGTGRHRQQRGQSLAGLQLVRRLYLVGDQARVVQRRAQVA